MSYRLKLQAAFLLIGLAAVGFTGWEASAGATLALTQATLERLTAVGQIRCRQMERYFEDQRNQLLALSTNESTLAAFEGTRTRWHPALDLHRQVSGSYDVLLIDRDGRVLYAVTKGAAGGVSLRAKPHSDSTLAKAFEDAIARSEPGTTASGDFGRAPVVAAPVWRRGEKIGVLAIELSTNEMNRIMGNGGEEGLGQTGQAYIVGSDGAPRREMRHPLEPAVIASIKGRNQGTEAGTREGGGAVLRSFAPLRIPGLDWWLIAEIDSAEALAPVADLRRRVLSYGALIAAGIVLIALLLGRALSQPVLALATGARRFEARDLSVRVPASSKDELGQIADSFNKMADDLERTTVSRQQLHQIFQSQRNALLVVDAERSATVDDLLNAPILLANPAAVELLGGFSGKFVGNPLRTILTEETEASRSMWRPLLDQGRLPAVETIFVPYGKPPVPVLLTAAFVSGNGSRTAGVVCAAQDITDRKHAETSLRQKQKEIEHLAGGLLLAQEEERSRLAHELHDGLAQRLAAIAIEAGSADRLPPVERRASLERIEEQMAQLSEEAHDLSRRLHPALHGELGLVAAVESECRGFLERGGPPVEFHHEGEFDSLSPQAQLALFRIVQEALTNIRCHAEASEANIRLARGPAAVKLEVSDNGKGFLRTQPDWRPGIGLASMEERARLLGGNLYIRSVPGQGTRISVSLPLENFDAPPPAG